MTRSLVDETPSPSRERLLADLVPPARFADASIESYRPDPEYPSQGEARSAIEEFAGALAGGRPAPRRGLFGRRKDPRPAGGLYLDGGFGVGKTHLLAAAYRLAGGHRIYGTFSEYTFLSGALGYNRAVELMADASLVCIDEFELDDPGDTLIMTRLIRELSDRGVGIVTTSNTLPEALGEGRFAASDFLREIQAMSDRFTVVRVDGEDYRHREGLAPVRALDQETVEAHAASDPEGTLDDFSELLEHLGSLHPSRYGALLDGVTSVHLTGTHVIDAHFPALRTVVLVDRLYDAEIPVFWEGIDPEGLFSEELLRSGYRKKYRRCLSRLASLVRDAAGSLTRA